MTEEWRLEWTTHRENALHAHRNGLMRLPETIHRGSASHFAKLDEEKVRRIKRMLARGDRRVEIAEEFGVCVAAIYHIHQGRTWRHVASV